MHAILTCPYVLVGLLAVLSWAPARGFPPWPTLAHGRWGSTLGCSLPVGLFAFTAVQRLTAPAAG